MNNFSRTGGHVTSPFQLYGGPLEKAGSEIIPDSEEERQGYAEWYSGHLQGLTFVGKPGKN